jgi:hypothetical protein
VPDGLVLAGILYVLRSGMPWRLLADELHALRRRGVDVVVCAGTPSPIPTNSTPGSQP